MEAHLTAERSGTAVRGVSGAHGVGAVMCAPDHVPTFERCESRRYLVWEGPILVYRVGEESGQYVARLCDNTLGDGCDVVPGAGLNRRTLEQGVEGKRPSARGQRYLDRCMVPRQVTGT